MSMNKKDFFDDDFEVIYEGDLPDLPEDDNDDYEDVLQKLADLDKEYETSYHSRKARGNKRHERFSDHDKDYDSDYDYDDADYDDGYDYDDDDYDDYDYDDDYDDDDCDYDDDDYDDSRRRSKKGKRAESKQKKKKRRKMPNLLSPVSKTAKAGGKAAFKIANLILRAATLILIAIIFCLLAVNFWKNYGAFGSIATAVAEKNYALAAYAAVAVFLLLFELITFFRVLSGSKKSGRKGRYVDTGRGLFSFLLIYAGSLLSALFYGLIPASPQPLAGVSGALLVYGSLRCTLFALCVAGVISCLIRKFAIR